MAKKQRQNGRRAGNNNVTGAYPSGNNSVNLSSNYRSSQQPSLHPASTQRQIQVTSQKSSELQSLSHAFPSSSSSTNSNSGSSSKKQAKSLWDWINAEREGLAWIIGCAALGAFLGFGVGCGWFTGGSGAYHFVLNESIISSNNDVDDVPTSVDASSATREMTERYVVAAWRVALASRIRRTVIYEIITLQKVPWPLSWIAKEYRFNAGKPASSPSSRGGKRSPLTPQQLWTYPNAELSSSSSSNSDDNSVQLQEPISSAYFSFKSTIPPTINPRSSTLDEEKSQHWLSLSLLWPPNWILFREIDISQIDVGEGGLSPIMVSFLSFLLPWRRPLIQALARKNTGKREEDNNQSNTLSAATSQSTLSSSVASKVTPASNAIPIDPYFHPNAFHTLREYIIRFDGGFVHPDLGFLIPSPSGASRGLGMVRDSYNNCQIQCSPGSTQEELLLNDNIKREKLKREEHIFERNRVRKLVEELLPDGDIDKTAVRTTTPRPLLPLEQDVSLKDLSKASPSFNLELPEEKGTLKFTLMEKLDAIQAKEIAQSSYPLSSPSSFHFDLLHNITTYQDVQLALRLQSTSSYHRFSQEEILLRIPLQAQITRSLALQSLDAIFPVELKKRFPIDELDDAPLLALLLTHERGLGSDSRFWPYIATLPRRPSCGWNPHWRQAVVDVVTAMGMEMGTDVQGWPGEISKAAEFAEKMVVALSRDYGSYLATRPGVEDVTESIRWSLCQVASRAIAGRDEYGSLRLVPVMDLINHDEAADSFVELTGKERISDHGFLDATEEDGGTFVVRSLRYGRKKPLRKGQELLANYNVPAYSPLDWFLNMGYIPPERARKWTMLDAALPRVQRGGMSRQTPGVKSPTGAFGSGKPGA